MTEEERLKQLEEAHKKLTKEFGNLYELAIYQDSLLKGYKILTKELQEDIEFYQKNISSGEPTLH